MDCFPFDIKPLPYDYNELEPYIDTKTLEIHHDKHYAKYVKSLNQTIEPFKQLHNMSVKELIVRCHSLPFSIQTAVINNAGGIYNHELYFNSMTPPNKKINRPTGVLACLIERKFGSFELFIDEFESCAEKLFGSGYCFLCADKRQNLKIILTPNQNTPLSLDLIPLLTIDVWEHAYYLKYQNLRSEYIDSFTSIIDWENAENMLNEML